MNQAKSVAQGFTAAANVIWLIASIWVSVNINLWLGLGLFVFLAVPFSLRNIMSLRGFNAKMTTQAAVKKAKTVLMALQGFGFACWFLDVTSTIFAININQTSSELNILGWPFGALGALTYYIPTTFLTYFLLYKVKSKESFYVAVIITAVTVFMGLRNLNAGLYNLSGMQINSSAAGLETLGILLAIMSALSAFNILAAIRKIHAWQKLALQKS